MKRLEITTFGGVNITIDGQPIDSLVARKTQALLIYLAHSGQKQSRERLAGLLWGDMPEEKARRNLRVALNKIRDDLEDYLIITRRSLAINPDSNVWMDAKEFEECLAYNPIIEQLEQAARLYKGPFLADFFLRDALSFEEWMQRLQENYRQKAMAALLNLTNYHTEGRKYSTAVGYAQRMLEIESWMEEAHRQLMYLYVYSGKRSLALAQYEICSEILWNELGVELSAETTALYEQIRDGEIISEPQQTIVVQPPPSPVKPVQIPAAPEHFVGRSAIIQSLKNEISDENGTAIQALTGMGGVGKSTLAIKIAHALEEDFPDGILWTNAASSEPMSVLESWATVYGYDFTRISNLENMAAAFRGILAEKRVLIVLDDVNSPSRIRPLLPGNNRCRVLLTTRDQELAQALNANIWPVRELSPDNGRELLASILSPGRVAAEPAAADQICSILQNLPLAVEITAQRLKSRPNRRLTDMAKRLQDETQRLSLLKISDREVRASFRISWGALDAERRRVFSLIGLYSGRSFTSESIAHIAELERYNVEDRLFDLVNLSLLQYEGNQRYRQHPLLADFAREHLDNELEKGNNRYSDYYLQFAQNHQLDFDTLRSEWDNLDAALHISHQYQYWSAVIDFVRSLQDFYFRQGRYVNARHAYRLAREAAQAQENLAVEAGILLAWGKAAAEQHDHEIARRRLERSRELFAMLNDSAGYADCQSQLARIALEQARFKDARALLMESREIRQKIEDYVGVGETFYVEARVAYFQGDYSNASIIAAKAIDLQEKFNDLQGLIYTLSLSGSVANQSKDLQLAEELTKRAITLCEQLDNQSDKSMLLGVLGETKRQQGDLDEAESLIRESLEMLKRFGDLGSQAQIYYQLSQIQFDKDLVEEALDSALECLTLSHQVDYMLMEGLANLQLGIIYTTKKDYPKAREHLEQAIKIGRQLNHKALVVKAQELLGESSSRKNLGDSSLRK